jgi:hypothetical protein
MDLAIRRRLLEQANHDYAALSADAEAWQAEMAERRMWDVTLQDGLDPGETSTEDGDAETRC